MRVVVVAKRCQGRAVSAVVKTLEDMDVEYRLLRCLGEKGVADADVAIVVGGDRDVLEAFHVVEKGVIPTLGVSDTNEEGFLTEIGVEGFKEASKRLLKGDFSIEEALRIGVVADGRRLPPALNELAVFSSRSATLVEHTLRVDGEVVWRDYSDGVIISTPTGSTAYAMSAGGPMVLPKADVFTVVSVNSLDVTRRPLVVSSSSKVRIEEISSRIGCEAVVDGLYRVKVKETVEAFREDEAAKLVRLPKASKALDKMSRKVKLAEELLGMPPSAKLVLKTLQYEGPMSRKELESKTLLPERTTTLALNLLVQKGLVKRKPTLRDARHKIYSTV